MKPHRFFVPPQAIAGEHALLNGDSAHQIRTVLRLRAGERVVLLDNSGWEFEVMLESVERDAVSGRVVAQSRSRAEPRARLTLYPALLKADKFEWVLQKCTELGVAAFQPVVTERCVRGEVSAQKLERWRRIVREAAEQSERGVVPQVADAVSFAQAVTQARGLLLMPFEAEQTHSLRACVWEAREAVEIALFIGPEGGFSDSEVALAHNRNVATVTLGRRILRAETASIAAVTAVLFERGEME